MSEQNFATIAGLRCISLRTSLTARLTSGAIAADPPTKVSLWVTAAKGEAVQMAITRVLCRMPYRVPGYAVPGYTVYLQRWWRTGRVLHASARRVVKVAITDVAGRRRAGAAEDNILIGIVPVRLVVRLCDTVALAKARNLLQDDWG